MDQDFQPPHQARLLLCFHQDQYPSNPLDLGRPSPLYREEDPEVIGLVGVTDRGGSGLS